MKFKPVSNLQEKCDEWLSTRNKKKISKPSPSIKRHPASTRKTVSSSKLWKLTQNSPPPPQLFSSTKQSVLMSFFNKTKNEDNTNDEEMCDDFDPDYGESEEQLLTNQFRFLSQDEQQPMENNVSMLKQRNSQQDKGDIKVLNTDGDNCRHNSSNSNISENNTTDSENDSDIEFVSQRPNAYNEIIQFPYHKTKGNETDNNNDIEFISQRNCSMGKKSKFAKIFHEHKCDKSDDSSDIEFMSQRFSGEKLQEYSGTGKHKKNEDSMGKNSKLAKTFHEHKCDKSDDSSEIEFMSQRFSGEKFQAYSGTAKHKNEDCGPSDIEFSSQEESATCTRISSRTSLINIDDVKDKNLVDDISNIEFFSQRAKVKNPESLSKICDNVKCDRNVIKNPCLSVNIQHCVNNSDVSLNSKSNSAMKERGKTIFCPRLTEENTDIEFVSQTVVERQIDVQCCRTAMILKNRKSETENSSVDSENSSNINSDYEISLNEKCENICSENALLQYRQSSLKSTKNGIGCSELLRQKGNNDDCDVDKVGHSPHQTNLYYRKFKTQSLKSKGDNSSKLMNKFHGKRFEFQELPDTIKFTDSETDSDEIMSRRLLIDRSRQNKRHLSPPEPDSIVFTLGDL
ncbi:myb-like protein F [Patella vulgata]|uniref:myb-like protein F n=1 Tax=Patella vulgata TaxID=6465 RepID=UPI0024A9F5A9|nr:myb-like protein F [Patella vulgata]